MSEHPGTVNQYDTWSYWFISRVIWSEVSSRKALYMEWEDNAESVKTHVHWRMRNCEGDVDKLPASLVNVVKHYRNQHEVCHPSSRCRLDPNYEPSKVIITSPVTERQLKGAIVESCIYRDTESYCLARDTFFVECFINVYEYLTKG